MSNRYVNAAASLTTTSSTTIYTVPGGCSALVQSIVVANEDSVTRTATAEFYDSSATATFTLIKDAGVPTASSLNMIDRPFVLEAGDQIRVTAGTANVMDVLASIMLVDESTSVPAGLVTTAALADGAVTSAKFDTGLSVTVVCTSATRPASPSEGQTIYETDTNLVWIYNGSAWVAPTAVTRTPSAQITGGGSAFTTNEGVGIQVTGMSTVSWDNDSMTTTANRLTVNTPGLYQATATILTPAGNSTDYRMGIRLTQFNSAGTQVQDMSHAGSYINIGWGKDRSIAGTFRCSQGDYIVMRIDVDSSTNNTGMTFVYPLLQATMISALPA